MDRAGKEVGVDFVGGFSALVQKGVSAADDKLMDSIPDALATTDRVCSSVNLGIHAGHQHGRPRLKWRVSSRRPPRRPPIASASEPASLVVFCNAVEDNPFMAGAFHGSGEADEVVNVGVSGPRRARRAGRPAAQRRHHHRRRGNQGHRFQNHPCRRVDGTRGVAHVVWACRRASSTCRLPPPPPKETRSPRY